MRQNKAKTFFDIVKKDKVTFVSSSVLLFWVLVALIPLFDSKFSDIPVYLQDRLAEPGASYWLGVDSNGQSVALLILNGASTSLCVSVLTVGASLLLGVPMGVFAGFCGGKIDVLISRVIDILLAFPPLILPIVMMAFFGGGILNVVAALTITGWVSYARLVRGQFLVFKDREFVNAARSLGASNRRLMFKHIFPNIISPLVVQITFSLAGVVISEAGLSFLGLGAGQNHVSWGSLLNSARDYLTTNPNLVFFPALALFSVVAALNFLGEALRIAFDPRR